MLIINIIMLEQMSNDIFNDHEFILLDSRKKILYMKGNL